MGDVISYEEKSRVTASESSIRNRNIGAGNERESNADDGNCGAGSDWDNDDGALSGGSRNG